MRNHDNDELIGIRLNKYHWYVMYLINIDILAKLIIIEY